MSLLRPSGAALLAAPLAIPLTIPLAILLALPPAAAAAPLAAAPVAAARPGAGGSGSAAPGCAAPLLADDTPAGLLASRPQVALQDSDATRAEVFVEAAAATGDSAAALRAHARDDATLWLDECARPYHVEPAAAQTGVGETGVGEGAAAGASTAAADAPYPLAQTFALSSRPGADLTIHLDFDGGPVTGTAWNADTGLADLSYPAVDLDGTPGRFTGYELAQLQLAWAAVAEDYAPFDVDVTTADPGADALAKSSWSDPEYGVRVAVTNTNPIAEDCSCGGVAYLSTLDESPRVHGYYTLPWVFADNLSRSGRMIGEAASHEVGHAVGLDHDATTQGSYYYGRAPWAPVMGAAYYQPVTQWSRGEYPDANRTEDDTAILAAVLGLRADDHADAPAAATPLEPGRTLTGVVEQRSDHDVFAFTAAGTTELRVTPSSVHPDLDVRLTVRDAAGAVVADVDPPASRVAVDRADGLGAAFLGDLPPGRYTATVDGTGTGDPAVAGRYSDYGSLGGYTVSLTALEAALTLAGGTLPAGTVGTAYAAQAGTPAGGRAPYAWSATGLPADLALDPATGEITGVPRSAGTFPVSVTVTDAVGRRATARLELTVAPDPATRLLVTVAPAPAAVVGTAYAARLAEPRGGTAPYSWAATGLPPGLTLDPATGVLSGVPTAAGAWPITVTVTDAAGSRLSVPTEISVAAPPAPQPADDPEPTSEPTGDPTGDPTDPTGDPQGTTEPPAAEPLRVVTRSRLRPAHRGRGYRAVLRIAGGEPGYTWQRRGRLPRGLRLVLPRDGAERTHAVLRGRPEARGRHRFRLVVVDASGERVRRTFRLRVR